MLKNKNDERDRLKPYKGLIKHVLPRRKVGRTYVEKQNIERNSFESKTTTYHFALVFCGASTFDISTAYSEKWLK